MDIFVKKMGHTMKLFFIVVSVSLLGLIGAVKKVPEKHNSPLLLQKVVQPEGNSKPTSLTALNTERLLTAARQSPTLVKKMAVVGQNPSESVNALKAGRDQCLVNGMVMYDGAAWSPRPCTMCICDRGKQVCEPVDCEEVSCSGGTLQKRPDSCCPVCVKTESPKIKEVAASTTKISQLSKLENKEKLKQVTIRKTKDVLARRPLKPVGSQLKNTQNGTASAKHQRKRKETGGHKQVENAPKKPLPKAKAVSPGKQETVTGEKDVDLSKANVLTNGGKWSKRTDQEKLRKEKTKQQEVDRKSEQEQSTKKLLKDTNEKHMKSNVSVSSLPAPTVLSIGPPVHPIETHIPSLPSGCILTESTIACGNTGMKYLPLMTDPGLKSLYLAENEISKLSARAFAGLPNLEWLDLSKNKLDDSGLSFDVFKNLTKLKRLNLDGNRLTELPLLPPSLQELKINDNKLHELNRHSFSGLDNLLNLELEGNNFHDGNVYPLTFKPLKNLIYLRLGRNQFRALPSGLPASLQELHLDNNHIEVVPEGILNKTLNLSVIALNNNRLQEDRIAPRAWIHLMHVESLDLSYNRMVHVPSFLPRGLKQLILHHNQIERIPGYVFAHLKPGLEFLHLSHNHLRDDGIHAVSFFGLYKSLNELLLDNNLFQSIPRGILNLRSLQVLRLSFNKIRYVPLNSICDTRISVDSNLVSIHLESNFINRRLIPPTAFSCIKSYHSVILRPQNGDYDDY
ncbi:extracellular matrix protein 2-like [Bombina bombina]|uniref:extracellular matrix protein 2-like n=1 Tax=Bombina bombina TaxID=8345 RepID=UPI00235AE7BB|nr:extracellular matrix protein 2-like [Bombina bombina]